MPLIDVTAAAAILHRSPQLVRRLAATGAIKAERIAGCWVFRQADVEKYQPRASGAAGHRANKGGKK